MDEAGLDVRIVQVLCSRIFHDLSGPLGAIRNGAELLEELGPDAGDEALKLVVDSAGRGVARLRLMRLAYGLAGESIARGFAEARGAATEWLAGGRTTLDWPVGEADARLETRTGLAKLALNAIVVAEEVLAHGGVIKVSAAGDAAAGHVAVVAQGSAIRFPPETEVALLADPLPEDIGPRTVHAYVTRRLAAHFGVAMTAARAAPDRFAIRLAW